MSEEEKKDDGMIVVNIDGKDIRCAPGTNIVELVKSMGEEIPHYCYHKNLSVSGNCRMCLVEMGMPGRDRATGEPMLNEDGSPKIMFFPGPAIACGTKASPGMHIKTKSDMVKKSREGVMEFQLINHPLDCPICDQAGECTLQEFASGYGKGYSRFVEDKVVKPKRTVLGPRVMLDDERCILCSRCIRFTDEIVGDDCLGFVDRGSFSTLTCFPGKELKHNYSLNTVDLCPVGALTSRDFRFKMRVWFLKDTPSICTESSVGVNTLVSSREGKIYRITPRENDDVNDSWMSDSGRVLYKAVEDENRLLESKGSVDAAVALLKDGKVAVVGSGKASVEEQYVLNRLSNAVGSVSKSILGRQGEGDELLISSDHNPNVRGALSVGLIKSYPANDLSELIAKVDSGEVDTVISHGEELPAETLEKVKLIYIGTQSNATSDTATVTIPSLTVFEKYGSFVNQQFRLQKFLQAVPGPEGVSDDLRTLSALLSAVDETAPLLDSVQTVWEALASEVSVFDGVSFESISPEGVQVDGSAFKDLPFCEGKTLHYDPAAETVETEGGA